MTTETMREMRELLRTVEIPAAVQRLAGDRVITPVWVNELGGVTCKVADTFIKWSPKGVSLRNEVERLKWVRRFTVVPEVLQYDTDEHGEWMVTRALDGKSAVDEQWRKEPLTAMIAIGKGLRKFHDSVPVEQCPFDWGIEARGGEPTTAPAIDKLVVCHGDACSPNTLLDANGEPLGHVDLGSMGVADRWADLAVASMSLDWNYEPANERAFFMAYGIERDDARVEYYRWLWDHDDELKAMKVNE